ncbi:MAG TPA: bifunctional tRNA (5-methylaminomethyl-2-thiouridine)(34)-methyltransferase MnmD/FAD-dependent 5-carboxymethylaminomethyl-2-thiouridine(34) oxidoreductase MnmC [Candidatus Tenderia electrophaga]|uniref:tRNA 5-methylaminomethyl-2-thiouridine biosynthesis bifunctional protein MnmC n=1 Tax=Candidatus Tenderia electrophaga TaxID=1748243 RepID=A0A832J7M9_9GAMM|nr:bifunctional tRNA (5-methylaminomethyl-2-thiouridine)(34)-methyltransferase MnmD/FAD-dependent 5-carboxymethylaminomethyl-2-thiouridine(34) oxidoreductase MnmC [Candidatus Tenderia electrophaga]
MPHYQPIEAARLDWDNGTPRSQEHGDIYFSTDGGIKETEYVFLQGNQLPQRWLEQDHFSIAETGFGTGLNFLCTLKHWQATAATSAHLNYISVEKHPLLKTDLQRAIASWPELAKIGAELIEHYPPLVHGLHQCKLFNGRVSLTLLFGDASAMLSDLETSVDAWYLDGFAPSKNPGMWTTELFRQIARLTKVNGSFATFTAAGMVRRGLKAAGFEVKTIAGFGRKRDMSVGRLIKPPQHTSKHPWFEYAKTQHSTKQAIVIGAGLAGCTISHTLAEQGWQITLIERHKEIAQQASGNLSGVLMPRLTADMSPAGQFYLSAFLHSSHWLNQLKQRDPSLPWFQSGVLQLCDEQQQQRMQTLGLPTDLLEICSRQQASERCGIQTQRGGLFFPSGGWLEPPALCQWLLDEQSASINKQLNQSALTLKRVNQQWQVIAEEGLIAEAETVIIANGYDAERLLDTNIFKLQKVRGQLVYLDTTTQSQRLKTPVCYDGYIIPSHKGLHCIGASYDINDHDTELRTESQQKVLSALNKEFSTFKETELKSGRVAFRTSTQDHLPLIGPVPNLTFYNKNYADLHHGKPAHHYPKAEYLPNLFLSVGHGSRGLVSCGYAAKLISYLLNATTQPNSSTRWKDIHPARYLIRRLITRKGA